MREKQIGLEIKQEVGTVGYFLNRNFEEGGGAEPAFMEREGRKGYRSTKRQFLNVFL